MTLAAQTKQKPEHGFNFKKNHKLKGALEHWHRELSERNKRDRAILCRISDPRNALATESFWRFEELLSGAVAGKDFTEQERVRLALIACLLAHVRGQGHLTLARGLKDAEVNKLRFQRLFAEDNPDNPDYVLIQFHAFRRMAKLYGGPFDIAQFAQDLYWWPHDEHRKIQMTWCQDFYKKTKTEPSATEEQTHD